MSIIDTLYAMAFVLAVFLVAFGFGIHIGRQEQGLCPRCHESWESIQ